MNRFLCMIAIHNSSFGGNLLTSTFEATSIFEIFPAERTQTDLPTAKAS